MLENFWCYFTKKKRNKRKCIKWLENHIHKICVKWLHIWMRWCLCHSVSHPIHLTEMNWNNIADNRMIRRFLFGHLDVCSVSLSLFYRYETLIISVVNELDCDDRECHFNFECLEVNKQYLKRKNSRKKFRGNKMISPARDEM